MATNRPHPELLMKSFPSCTAPLTPSEEKIRDQLAQVEGIGQPEESQGLIVTSPYVETPHLLDLCSVEPQAQLLAIALTGLKSLREDYATAEYVEAFNWAEVITTLRQLCAEKEKTWSEQMFYIVVFRSQIPPTTDYSRLGALDKAAHAEAMKSGGFLKYWFGRPNKLGRNLATCIWRTQEDAKLGGIGPAHRRAVGAARHMYTEWSINRLGLLIGDGVKNWKISDWGSDT